MQDGVAERPLDHAAVKTAEKSPLTPRNERRMKELLEALCDPTRVKIVRALRETTLPGGDLPMLRTGAAPPRASTSRCCPTSAAWCQREPGTSSATRSSTRSAGGQVIEKPVGAVDQMELIGGGAGDELSAGV